jgi:methylmalonyl-CoA carboxyltransferase small subunit
MAAPPISKPKPPAPSSAAVVTGERIVKAPIVGTILNLKVSAGDVVTTNQVLLVMEAMKMETNVASPLEGKVKAILVAPGDAVKTGQALIELE